MVIRSVIIVWILLKVASAEAQSCFARIQLDRKSVYVQEPFRVTITVLTATWFTAPVEFDNLQVPNAFVLPFSRNFPGMFDHQGKQYAGIQFHFIVFPYRAGEFTIPPIVVHATTPPEGSSQSRRTIVKTTRQHFTVKAVPATAKDKWFVAKSVTIHERWNKSLAHLKVGDILERTITVKAYGTLPQFIPALKESDLSFANVYPQDPELKDLRNDNDANGELTQSFLYLMEKDGTFELPPMQIQWWNPGSRKMKHRTLPKHQIAVATNPDLGMIASIKDSLDVSQHDIQGTVKSGTPTILGLPWYAFAAFAVVTILAVYIIIRLVIRAYRTLSGSYHRYLRSESHQFRQLMTSSPASMEFWKRLYAWWDRLPYPDKPDGLTHALEKSGDDQSVAALKKANKEIYHDEHSGSEANGTVKKALRHFRKWLFRQTSIGKSTVPDRQREFL